MRSLFLRGTALLTFVLAGCSDGGGTGPVNPKDLSIAVQGGDQQIWSPGATLPKPLQVVVKKTASREPVANVLVTWQVTQGSGATLTPSASRTDSTGIASTNVTLGSGTGAYTITASFDGNVGPAAVFHAEAASGAEITSITPASVRAGDTITISGQGFSSTPQNNVVLFDGIRGAIVSATLTQLRVVLPLCLPTRTVQVTVLLGAASTVPVPLAVTGSASTLTLDPGQATLLTDPAAITCAALTAGSAGASYLIVVENATDVSNRPMDFQLLGVPGGQAAGASAFGSPVAAALAGLAQGDVASDFELRLRQNEAQLVRNARAAGRGQRADLAPTGVTAGVPVVGDTGTFNVLSSISGATTFKSVKAVVKLVTPRSIIYQDVNAPTGGFTTTDFQQFGAQFDDPIYPTDTSVYGSVSDVDGNGHVIILFTPVVNAMSPKGSTSFVAGFFYGCDLLTKQDCNGSNVAEIFYASVPDPNGTIGPTLSKTRIMQTTPPVLAHEFMHMIHFNQRVLLRNAPDESLWLSEALAHTAEDTVGGVYLQRGDSTTAVQFMSENWRRANDYLEATESTSLLAYTPPGSLAERGAGWLFIKYLRSRFGGSILGKLTQTALSSTVDVTTQTGLGWSVLVNDWLVALWADDAPDLASVSVDPKYTFTNINLRRTLGQPAFGGVYLLQPTSLSFLGFNQAGSALPSSTGAYYIVTGTGGAAPVALSLAAPRGVPFGSDVVPQLAIMRIR